MARPAPSCDVMVPLVAEAALAARFFLLARFFLFLLAFFPGAGAGADCIERIIVVAVVDLIGVVVKTAKRLKTFQFFCYSI